jgi:ABC-2 type transport system ATP-binding protein
MIKEAIEFQQVEKSFGKVHAVKSLSLSIESGCFVGLIGHNGAGKSTMMSMLMGLLKPTQGTLRVHGVDVVADPREARRLVGAVPEEPALFEYLTGREYLEYVAEIRGGGDLQSALDLTGLGNAADRLIREYSQGMRRKTAFAAALLGDPKILVLDESLNGLDPPSAARVKVKLREFVDAGGTVLLSTHVLDTIEKVADRVIMLAHGRVVVDEMTQTLPEGGLESLFLTRLHETHQAGEDA